MLEIGQVLNDSYKIIERIGSGGGGIIYKAYHLRMRKDVAIKLIKNDLKGKINNRSEVDMLKNLKNDYLPQVIDFVEDGEDVYTVMEYIDGKNFRQLIERGRHFTEKQVKKYALQLCEAVEYLHNHVPPIIHSDIKPANVMLTPQDNICLIDFNISMMTGNGKAVSVGGSQGFGAPEQFKKYIEVPVTIDDFHEETRFVDEDETEILLDEISQPVVTSSNLKTKNMARAFIDIRTDIYGIGATVYYMLTGRVPQSGRLDFRGIRCSAKLREVIEKAMAPIPAKRYKNVAELKRALKSNITFKPVLRVLKVAAVALGAVMGVGALVFLVAFGVSKVKENLEDNDNIAANGLIVSAQSHIVTEEYEQAIATFHKAIEIDSKTEDNANSEAIPDTKNVKPEVEFITIKGKQYSSNLTELDLSSCNLNNDDIKDLKYMTNLKILSLMNNQISDINSLSNLTNLSKLYLNGNDLRDINPLSDLTNLTELYLDDNQVNDISALINLTNLEYLYMSNNQLSDISALRNLTKLTVVYLMNNKIIRINSLSGLYDLKELALGGNEINDISSISNLTILENLSLWDNQISDISALNNLTNLKSLILNNNQITDINSLRSLKNLELVNLSDNQISHIEALSSLINITELKLANNSISDIGSLGNLTDLTALDLTRNPIEDISILGNMTKLVDLSLGSNKINDISVLSSLINLEYLHLWIGSISDLSALSYLPKIKHLYLGNNKVNDISALINLTTLEYLELSNNSISPEDIIKLKSALPNCEISY